MCVFWNDSGIRFWMLFLKFLFFLAGGPGFWVFGENVDVSV